LGQERYFEFFLRERIPHILATNGIDSIRRRISDRGVVAIEKKPLVKTYSQGSKE
jgi:hypothetical protein